jgi:predicted TIM-barrel fold metal-dependent hydrolase
MLIDACCTIRPEAAGGPSFEFLLGQMDRAAVDRAVVHPSDRGYAWENDEANAFTIAAAQRQPNRLIAAVTANPWRPDAWERLHEALRAGGRMVSFSPAIQGFAAGSKILDPILESLAKYDLRVPIYIHTGHHSHGAPSQLFLLARRFPGLNFIMGHSGATDYALDVVPVCQLCHNIYPESSFARPPGFVGRLKTIGWERGIMGSGFPDNDLSFEWSEMRRLLPAEHQEAVLGGNLARLLGGVT